MGRVHCRKTSLAMQTQRRAIFSALCISMMLVSAACTTVPRLIESPPNRGPVELDQVPVIIVGQIERQIDLGSPHPSAFNARIPIELRKLAVRVETVIKGNVRGPIVQVYYLHDLSSSGGPPRVGTNDWGGRWSIGDRLIWFLRWDSGVLRTVSDTSAHTTVTVLTGLHPNYQPSPNESVADQIIDIMLDDGKGCEGDHWALAILKSSMRASSFDLAYTVAKLRHIASSGGLYTAEAAVGELERFSCIWPQYRDTLPSIGCPWPQLYPEVRSGLRPDGR